MQKDNINLGNTIYKWATDLFPICRSLTGDGIRETLSYLKTLIPELKINEVLSGTKAFDWTVPDEWNIQDAYIADESGNKIIDFKKNNLHVVGYSVPVDKTLTFEELENNLYSIPTQPDAIPYITSYYSKRWGFCITENQIKNLRKKPFKQYHVKIDSTLTPGVMNYGELILRGKSEKEILISTYICHPSMANNELSGPCVTSAIARWLINLKKTRFTYRIIFIPETIGSIYYISKHLKTLKERLIAGFVISCIGDDKGFYYIKSREENTLADRLLEHIFKYEFIGANKNIYSFLDRGSDERQFCSPKVNLPVCTIGRTKFGEYPEYHTSLDNLDFISPNGLLNGMYFLQKCIKILEANYIYDNNFYCEPQLGKRGLYPTLSTKKLNNKVRLMINFLAYLDGEKDLLEIANIINCNVFDLLKIANTLYINKIINKK